MDSTKAVFPSLIHLSPAPNAKDSIAPIIKMKKLRIVKIT